MTAVDGRAAELLARFGHSSYREGQEEAVSAAMAGRDVLAVMPTGAGKSLCYQLPALAGDGLTVVVSPLIALMDDQIRSLEHVAPGAVAAIHGNRSTGENDEALDSAASGKLRILYLAPERLANPQVAAVLRAAELERLVVDEAHCVSAWGHDFRPEYLRLGEAARKLGTASLSAFTATATPRVAGDVVARLGLVDPAVVRTGFDRPNISFAVANCANSGEERRQLLHALSDPGSRPAIVYCATRKQAEEVASALSSELRITVDPYHAGMDGDARRAVQQRFMAGESPVVVATNAFGMGVDKPDVRTVVHVAVPSTLEAYYQEAGRAGRDGHQSKALLLAERRDQSLHVFFIKGSIVEGGQLDAVAEALAGAADSQGIATVPARELRDLCDGSAERLTAAVGHLALGGVIGPIPSQPDQVKARITGGLDRAALAKAKTAARDAERNRWQRYREIWGFVDGTDCRRAAMLTHFGDTARGRPLGACCDRCDRALVPASLSGTGVAARAGARRPSPTRASPIGKAGTEALKAAIVGTVREASPEVGRTRLVEILRGGSGKDLLAAGHDKLPDYGAFAGLRRETVLGVVDTMLEGGELVSSGGRFPKVRLP